MLELSDESLISVTYHSEPLWHYYVSQQEGIGSSIILAYNSSISARLKRILLSEVKAASTSNTAIVSVIRHRSQQPHHLLGTAGLHARAW